MKFIDNGIILSLMMVILGLVLLGISKIIEEPENKENKSPNKEIKNTKTVFKMKLLIKTHTLSHEDQVEFEEEIIPGMKVFEPNSKTLLEVISVDHKLKKLIAKNLKAPINGVYSSKGELFFYDSDQNRVPYYDEYHFSDLYVIYAEIPILSQTQNIKIDIDESEWETLIDLDCINKNSLEISKIKF